MRLQKKTNKKPIIVASIIIIVLLLVTGVYFWLLKPQFNKDSSISPAEQATKQDLGQNKTKETSSTSSREVSQVDRPQAERPEKEKEIQPPYEGENINEASALSGVVTYSTVAGSNLIIRTSINQALGSGTCQLTLSNSTKSISKTSNIAPNPSSSTCEGFDITVSEISNGNWNISIVVTSGNRSGTLKGSVQI